MAQEEQDVIDRYYFSRYGRNDLNLIKYGERSCFSDPKPRAIMGRFPPQSQLYPLLAFEKNMIKTFKKTKQKFTALFPFFIMRGKNVLTLYDKLKG